VTVREDERDDRPPPEAWVDDAVRAAAASAGRVDIHRVAGKKPERALVEAFRDGLGSTGHITDLVLEQPSELPNWSTPPGGIDLVAKLDGGLRLDFEMKVDKPDEVIWDAIKLADVNATRRREGATISYLVLWATSRSWVVGEASSLFDMPRTWGVKEMIETWPKAWNGVRVGGRGKIPRTTVAEIGFEPIAEVRSVSELYDASIKVVRLWPSTTEALDFDREGWPVGMEVPDTATPMAEITGDRPRSPSGVSDPCHGYLWLDRWTQRDLESTVPALDADARACLRSRLHDERGWSDVELVERFDGITALPEGGARQPFHSDSLRKGDRRPEG
jgi:hypothetical protein